MAAGVWENKQSESSRDSSSCGNFHSAALSFEIRTVKLPTIILAQKLLAIRFES